MAVWYRFNLGDAMLASKAIEHVQSYLAQSNLQAHTDYQIFYHHESTHRLHCDQVLYIKLTKALDSNDRAKLMAELSSIALLYDLVSPRLIEAPDISGWSDITQKPLSS